MRPSSTFAPRHRESPVPVQRRRRGGEKKKNIKAEKASANIPQLSQSSFPPPLPFVLNKVLGALTFSLRYTCLSPLSPLPDSRPIELLLLAVCLFAPRPRPPPQPSPPPTRPPLIHPLGEQCGREPTAVIAAAVALHNGWKRSVDQKANRSGGGAYCHCVWIAL